MLDEKENHKYNIDNILLNTFNNYNSTLNIKIQFVNETTYGSPHTCSFIFNKIEDKDLYTVIYFPNIYFEPHINLTKINNKQPKIFTIKSNDSTYSYAKLTLDNKNVLATKEKVVISNYSIISVYCFQNFIQFEKYLIKYLTDKIGYSKEKNNNIINEILYMSELYNYIIDDKIRVYNEHIQLMYSFRTYDDCLLFENKFWQKPFDKHIAIACDHSGYNAKQILLNCLNERNVKYIDYGCYSKNDCDYVNYVNMACKSINNGTCLIGFGICRTGQGVNICANKKDNIISALLYSDFSTKMAVEHNGANFFCIPGGEAFNKQICNKYLDIIKDSKFQGGRFQNRIMKL